MTEKSGSRFPSPGRAWLAAARSQRTMKANRAEEWIAVGILLLLGYALYSMRMIFPPEALLS